MRVRQRVGRGWVAFAVATGLVVTLGACSGGDDDGGEKSESSSSRQEGGKGDSSKGNGGKGDPLAQVKGSAGITLTIQSAAREEGGFVTLNGEIQNSGNKFWSGVEWKADESELADSNPSSMAGASLVDKKGKKRYLILRDTEGRCLCSTFKGGLQAGQKKTWYAQFPAPPEGNNEVDFQVGDIPTTSVSISEG